MVAPPSFIAENRSRSSTILLVVACALLAGLVGLATVKLGSLQHQLKAVGIVIAGVALMVAALRPQLGLVILIALTPFEFEFLKLGSDQVLLLSVALVTLWRIQSRAIPSWTLFGGISLVLGSFIASIVAHNRGIAFEGAINWLGAVIVLFVALTVFRERRDASRRMIDIFTGSAVIVVIFAFLQKSGIDVIVSAEFNPGYPNSFFAYYTIYAGYVAMAATLATGEILIAFDQRQLGRAGKYGAALVFMLVGLAVSTSRGGLIALACGWLLLLVFNFRRGSILAKGIVILVIFVAAGYVSTPASTISTIKHRFALSNGAQTEDKERFALHKAGEEALAKNPLGLGYGNFSYYLSENLRSANIEQSFFHAHETPIQVGLDAGWLGLAGFLVLFAWPILLVFRRGGGGAIAGGGISAVRASAFAAALGGFMAQGLYDYFFYDLAFLVFFVAMVWGTVHSLSIDAEHETLAPGPPAWLEDRSHALVGPVMDR
jgi:O-antigen ligase